MKPRINCITLAVDDLKRSLAFYRDGLGLPAQGVAEGDDHFAIELEGGLYLVLILRTGFSELAKIDNQGGAASRSSECVLSYFAVSDEEVDTILRRAVAKGGTMPDKAKVEPRGYVGYVKDPDGHLWEILWNPRMSQEMHGQE